MLTVSVRSPNLFKIRDRQRGMSLVESLVALLVLALGIMGLAGVQTRLLTETRTTNSRAIAVELIADLTNRMMLNRDHALLAAGYNLAWGAIPAAVDCATLVCTNIQVAQSDLSAWRQSVARLLPGGDARVFQLIAPMDPRQIGVMIAWRANEGKSLSDTGASPVDAAYTAPFVINSGVPGETCPPGSLCHLVYVQP